MTDTVNLFENDPRTVLTLDAGGTNLVFSAIRGCREITEPVRLPSVTDNLRLCLERIVSGFSQVRDLVDGPVAAISFAFPGPADYRHGIIGDLPNFPCFRGGVALGPYLERVFGVPVFINNDGNLFAYGEALAGVLPQVNAGLHSCGSRKRYHNLLGLTFGTGFGAGVVINGVLLDGDNGCGGDVWLMRNTFHPGCIAEESVSVRAVKRVYRELSGDGRELTPRDIFDIASGNIKGDPSAARETFSRMGTAAADAITSAMNIVDGLIVIGGGLSGAWPYFMPALTDRLNSKLRTLGGDEFGCLQMKVFNLMDDASRASFMEDTSLDVRIPGTDIRCEYNPDKKTGITVTSLGTDRAVALGSYVFALRQMDSGCK